MEIGDCERRSSYIGVNTVLSYNNLQYANYSFSLHTHIGQTDVFQLNISYRPCTYLVYIASMPEFVGGSKISIKILTLYLCPLFVMNVI
jgi:hypothetical protein